VPYPPKPPTPQIVGAILKRAGLNRSQSSGVYNRTAGYSVRKSRTQPDAVEVRWWPDSREDITPAGSDAIAKRRTGWLQRYADAIVTDPLYRGRLRCQLSEPDGKVTVYARSS
jgi:hypothetical protein